MDNANGEEELNNNNHNATPNFNGTYGNMVLMPKSFYDWAIGSAKQILPSLQQQHIAENVKKAK